MYRTLETLFLALSLAFVGWLIIVAGMKFEVRVGSGIYGFQIGGPDNHARDSYKIVKGFNGVLEPQNTMVFIDQPALVAFDSATTSAYLTEMYPMYQKPIVEKHNLFYVVYFEGRNLLPMSEKYRIPYSEPRTIYYCK